MPTTPEEWLPILAKKLDARARHTKRLRSYCDGNAPLPEMGQNLRASWEAFQKKSRINYGGLAVWALKRRIRPRGVRLADNPAALAAAQRIWRDNRLTIQFGAAIVDRLEATVGYLAVGRSQDGKAVITREKPELFFAITDAVQTWRAKQTIKVWRDEIDGKDYAWVGVFGQRQKFVRDSKVNGVTYERAFSNDWVPALNGDEQPIIESYDGDPPVIVLERPSHQALIEPHLDLIDSINLGKLQRLVITAMQAFKQRALKKSANGAELPAEDDDGNDIDYRKLFEPAPGALWDLPEGIDIWESEAIDIRPLLEGEKADARTFAAVTTTPVSVFIPDGQNQSAEGAANAKEGHITLAEDEIDDIAPGLALAIVYGLRFEGVDLGDSTVELDFAPPALVSLSEKYAAAAQAKGAGLARKTILRTVLGMTPDEIKQDEVDLADEQLAAFMLTGGTTPAPAPAQGGGGGAL